MIKKVIWLVDDDQIYHIIMKKIIIKADVCTQVTSFFNGKDAIIALSEAIANNTPLPDLILLDIEMPVLDGWGFMKEWLSLKNQLTTKISIYISSSSIAIEDKQRAKNNADILGYMSKPVNADDLILICNGD
jgi:CheY-like chemotaxis protein